MFLGLVLDLRRPLETRKRDRKKEKAQEKQLAELVAHLKYMWVEQRSDAYDARKPRAQQQGTVSGHQLVRMDARAMCQ